MRAALFGTRAGAILYRRRLDKLLGYPRKATSQVGGGRHAPIQDAWDGTGATPPGWTRQHARPLKHPLRDEWAVASNGEVAAALADARAQRLTASERTAVQNAVAAAQDLDGSWDDAAEDDD